MVTRPTIHNAFIPLRGVLIAALRRSGSTILWETFRRDNRNVCFDEPFHPALWEGARKNAKGTWPELSDLWGRLGGPPVEGAGPIRPIDELERSVTLQQRAYFRLLFNQSNSVVVDEVRGWNKLPGLLEAVPDILVIHLVRSPIGWVTAHLLPSGGEFWRRQLSNIYRRSSFFFRNRQFNNWQYEEIIEQALRQHHPVFRRVPQDTKHISRQPAYKKLLAFWWAAVQQVDRDLRQSSGMQFITVTLEEFSMEPDRIIKQAYSRAGWPTPLLNCEHVKSVNSGWKPSSEKWSDAFEWAGVPIEFVNSDNFTGAKLEQALDSLASKNDYLSQA